MLSKKSKADAQNSFNSSEKADTPIVSCRYAKQPPGEEDEEMYWVEIELVGEDNQPLPGETYRVSLSDGTVVKEGSLNMRGFARVVGISEATCLISFPNLHGATWDTA